MICGDNRSNYPPKQVESCDYLFFSSASKTAADLVKYDLRFLFGSLKVKVATLNVTTGDCMKLSKNLSSYSNYF